MTLRLNVAVCALAYGVLSGPVAAQDHPPEMHIHDAYARTTAKSGAVYFMLHNNTGTDDRLVAVTTDDAYRAGLHASVEDADGMMTMVDIEDGLALPAGEMKDLSRGGDHLMLLGLTRALADGDTITLTLTFEVAGDMTLEVPVDNARKPGEGGQSGGAMDHGSGGDGTPKE